MVYVVIFLVTLLIIGLVFSVYFWWSDWVWSVAPEHMDWQSLGSFMGGVAGPLLIVMLIVFVVYSLRQQSSFLADLAKENSRLDMLRHLNKLDDEISHVLMREVPVEGAHRVELGDFVDGLVQVTPLSGTDYKGLINKLLKLTADYCEALDVYRSEVQDQFAYKIHLQRAKELTEFLQKNPNFLNPMAKQVLGYCKMHINDRKSSSGASKKPVKQKN